MREHGLPGYRTGCRCDICRNANAVRGAEYRASNVDRLRAYRRVYFREHQERARLAEERSCAVCGKAFRPWAGKSTGSLGRYCSTMCANSRKRKAPDERVSRHLVRDKGHPLAGKGGRVLAYRAVLFDRIGPGEHPCHWCGREVAWAVRAGRGTRMTDLVVDHLDGDSRNDAGSNLAPSCVQCNALRSQMQSWMDRTGLPIGTLL